MNHSNAHIRTARLVEEMKKEIASASVLTVDAIASTHWMVLKRLGLTLEAKSIYEYYKKLFGEEV